MAVGTTIVVATGVWVATGDDTVGFALVSDSRDGSTKQRLQVVASEKGLWRCHTIFECTAVCPKGIPITAAIEGLKRKVMFGKLKSLIGLGR